MGRGSDLKNCEITVFGTFNFNHDNEDNDKQFDSYLVMC